MHLYQSLEVIRWRYYNNQIDKVTALKLKNKVLHKYDEQMKEYEFLTSMFQEHIEKIRSTEMQRTRLRKMLNEKIRTDETLDIAIEILGNIFEGEF